MREFSWKVLGAVAAMAVGALSTGCAGSVAEPHYAAAWAVSQPAPASEWQEASVRLVPHVVHADSQAKRAHYPRRFHTHARPKPHHHYVVAAPAVVR